MPMVSQIQIDEALSLLQEECAEIIQIVSKIRRFGFDSHHPDDPDKVSNIQLLQMEMGDYDAILNYLIENGVVNMHVLTQYTMNKEAKLRKFTNLFNN